MCVEGPEIMSVIRLLVLRYWDRVGNLQYGQVVVREKKE